MRAAGLSEQLDEAKRRAALADWRHLAAFMATFEQFLTIPERAELARAAREAGAEALAREIETIR